MPRSTDVRKQGRDRSDVNDRQERSDGRDTRWAEHRRTRRVELVAAALKAIRRHGAGVGMDEIAAEAGTSKTVIYRHFSDKSGLYLAVVEAVDGLILHDLGRALDGTALGKDPRGALSAVVDSYLLLVERDPEVYRFVVTRPLLDHSPPALDDPVTGLTGRIADQITAMLAATLQDQGRDPAPALIWGPALVGLVRAAADHWIRDPDQIPRAEIVRHVTDLAWGGMSAALGLRSPPKQRSSVSGSAGSDPPYLPCESAKNVGKRHIL